MACFTAPSPVGAGMVSSGSIGFLGGIRGGGVCFVEVCFGSGMSFLGLHTIYMMNITSLIFLG